MDKRDLEPILKRLDALIKLVAINVTKDKSLKEQVRMLDKLEFKPSEIGELLGKTPNYVRVTLHDIRKSSGAHGGKQ